MSEIQNNTEIEMELAYLPKYLPEDLMDVVPVRVTDIYLSEPDELLSKLRLRQSGTSFEITKKVVLDPEDLSIQEEATIELNEAEYAKLALAGGRSVVKDRYVTAHGMHVVEFDIFRGALSGLGIVEFEFTSNDDKQAFIPPDFCGEEVTQEDFIAGAYLAGKTYADISGELARFGYTPLYHEA